MPKPDVATDPRFTKNKWKPGQSGNPRGRPKTRTLEDEARAVLGEVVPRAGMTYREAIARALIRDAIAKDGPSRKLLVERLWPAPKSSEVLLRTGDPPPAEGFPAPAIDALSDDDKEQLRKLAHSAIMASGAIDADYTPVAAEHATEAKPKAEVATHSDEPVDSAEGGQKAGGG